MTLKILSPEFIHSDERGSLTQLVSGGYSQINIVVSESGVTRGGHYHKACREAFYIIEGAVKVTAESGGEITEGIFRRGDFFEIYPHTAHEMYFPERCIMAVLYDKPVETESGKDIYEREIMR